MSRLLDFIDFSKFLRVKIELGFDTLHYWTESEIKDLHEQVKHFNFGGVFSEVTEKILQANSKADAQWKWQQLSVELQDIIFIVPDDYFSDRYNTDSDRDIYIREFLIDTLNSKMKFLHDELVSFGERHGLKADEEHIITPMYEIDYKRIGAVVASEAANVAAKIDEVKAVAVGIDEKVTPKPKKKRKQKTDFKDIIQYENKEKLLKRLHYLIDGKSGADVGAVLLKAIQEKLITGRPTEGEFKSEFQLKGSWSAISNYMDGEKIRQF